MMIRFYDNYFIRKQLLFTKRHSLGDIFGIIQKIINNL